MPEHTARGIATALVPRFLLITVLAVVLPMSIVGAWATQVAARSGRLLLRTQLTRELQSVVNEATKRWNDSRTALLTLGESEPVRRVLADSAATTIPVTPFVRRTIDGLAGIEEVAIYDERNRPRLRISESPVTIDPGEPRARSRIELSLTLTDLYTDHPMGAARAALRVVHLVPAMGQIADAKGPLLAIRTADGRVMTQGGVDPALFTSESVTWSGRTWSTVTQALPSSGLTLLMAGELAPYRAPFTEAAQRSTLALLVTAALGVVVVLLLTRQLTRVMERDYAQREALASVGEFASELAHEVRNPLGAMRLDLQRAQELVDDPDEVATILPRVLGLVDRLERAVSGALRVTRGRTDQAERVRVADVVARALTSATPEFARREAQAVHRSAQVEATVLGDAGALEQLVLNLLLNAAQALEHGGTVTIEITTSGRTAHLRITDTGRGMTAERLAELDQPYRSSRRDGTGLGIKIARRIAQHHGGSLHFSSTPGKGTVAEVLLPLA